MINERIISSKIYKNEIHDEERALYSISFASVLGCKFFGEKDGESALKESNNLIVKDCEFKLRYPLWHNRQSIIEKCKFFDTARAPLWYCENIKIGNSIIDGVKTLRESKDIEINNCKINSPEFGWKCKSIDFFDSSLSAEYAFLLSSDLYLKNINFCGKYSFQYIENSLFEFCSFNTKDAFWHSKNVTVKNCKVYGEYLGWYSENLTLIDCEISSIQPLCYANNLKLINCKMIDCNLSFENSTVEVEIVGTIESVKNPIGKIKADKINQIIIDEFSRGKCEITTKN